MASTYWLRQTESKDDQIRQQLFAIMGSNDPTYVAARWSEIIKIAEQARTLAVDEYARQELNRKRMIAMLKRERNEGETQ